MQAWPAGGPEPVLDHLGGYTHALARCPEISLRGARERAGRELVAIRAGETDPLERRREAREAPTVGEGLDRFFNEYAPARQAIGRMAPKTIEEYGYAARRCILPALGALKVAAVSRQHVERMIDPLPRVQRHRVLARTSRLFTLFEAWEQRPPNTNPARGIERARGESRDRVLAPSELAALSAALDQLEGRFPTSVAAIRFAAVTGLRIGEVIAIKWQDVDFEQARLTMPQTKTGRRQHNLPAPALDILRELPRVNGNGWAFTTGQTGITYRTVRLRFAQAVKLAGLRDVRLHDLRRGFMTVALYALASLSVVDPFYGSSAGWSERSPLTAALTFCILRRGGPRN